MRKIIFTTLLLFCLLPKSNGQNISKEVLQDIINSIPSPLEFSFLIKDLGTEYDKSILHQPENTKYNTKFKQALNLGIFEADLGYIQIYNEEYGSNYIEAIKELANKLGIGEYFDAEIIELISYEDNLDSLLTITNSNFEQLRNHLQDIKKSELAVLILVGGWLEAIYITCKAEQNNPEELFRSRVAGQKIIFEQLLLLLSFFDEDKEIKNLRQEFVQLENAYSTVKNYQITKEAFDKVFQATEKIRNKIIE